MENFDKIFDKVLSFFRILTIGLIILTTVLGCINEYLKKESNKDIYENITTSYLTDNSKNEYIPWL